MKDADWERLLRQSLATTAEPEEKLNQSLMHQLIVHSQLKHKYRKRLTTGLIAAVLLIVLSISAYATVQLFSAKQVAEHMGDQLLAHAFESEDAIQINQSMVSRDYRFTLHGLVTGAGLSEFRNSSEDIYPDRTYAVVSITRQDGKSMPNTNDPDYGMDPIFISPLIKGLKPWLFNIASMNGSYSEDVIDGIMYRLIECDQVEVFADRGVYLAISSGTKFYSNEAFRYDEITGEIQAKEDYSGASVLFNLPLDVAKADPVKAEAYLEAHASSSQGSKESLEAHASSSQGSNEHHAKMVKWGVELRGQIRNGESIGEIIHESVKEVIYGDSGNITYTYGELSVTTFLEGLAGVKISTRRCYFTGTRTA